VLRDVVLWGLVALGATAALLIWLGVPWPRVAAGCAGLLAVLLLAYLLNRSGLMRLTHLDSPAPSDAPETTGDSRPPTEQ
jgi:hypothetical protein